MLQNSDGNTAVAVAGELSQGTALTASEEATTSARKNGAWDDELMTTRELMAFLSLSRTKVWELVNKEQLPAFKIGGDYRYRRSEILAWMERFRVKR